MYEDSRNSEESLFSQIEQSDALVQTMRTELLELVEERHK
eukprot:SM018267S04161  [mRNA]  locus=s18267:22:138:- [translate_table: standard]